MFTGNAPEYIRHTFKVKSELKSYTVYELAEVVGKTNLLTELWPECGKKEGTVPLVAPEEKEAKNGGQEAALSYDAEFARGLVENMGGPKEVYFGVSIIK